jgi:hypothetical protein
MSKERSLGVKAAELSQKVDVITILAGAGFWIIGKKDLGVILIGTSVITYVGAEWFKRRAKKQQ